MGPLGPTAGGSRCAFRADGRLFLVDRGEVSEVAASSFSVSRTIALADDPGPDSEASGRGVPPSENHLSGALELLNVIREVDGSHSIDD